MEIESYESVLDFLDEYFTVRVKDDTYLSQLKALIAGSRRKKMVTIRPIQLTFLKYREEFNDYSIIDEEEKNLWVDLLDYWQ